MNQISGNILNYLLKTKYYLIAANILLTFFLILLSNLGVFPMRLGDFVFFSLIYLIFALYRPGWSFLFFVGTIALENINLAPVSLGFFVRPYQMIGALTFLSLLIRYFLKRLNFKLVKFKWFDYVIAVFIFSGFLSSFFAQEKGLALKQSLILFSFAIFYWLVRNYIQTLEDIKKILPFFLGSSLIVVFYGIWQNVIFIKGFNSFEVMPGRPNSTFMEADWLGIYLALSMAILYSIIYYFNKVKDKNGVSTSNFQLPISNEISNFNFQNAKYIILTTLYIITIPVVTLLILTVSRSAWLGAGLITLIFLKGISTNFSFSFDDWKAKELLKHFLYILGAGFASLGIISIFNLTNFQLFNRMQSTGTGLQKITIACQENLDNAVPEIIDNNNDLQKYHCWHINLEDIEKEKSVGNVVMEVYRKDPNISVRSNIYQKSIAEIKKHPVFGIGWGNISSILGKDERGTELNASNIFLEVWLGSGILGILSFLVIWVYIFTKSVIYVLKKNVESKVIGNFLTLGFFALLIPNLFNAGTYLGIFWVWMGVVLSLNRVDN